MKQVTRRPDLLILIAVWEFLTVMFALIGIAGIAVFAFPEATVIRPDAGAIFGLSIATFVLLVFIGLAAAGGIGLLTGKEWGRILSIVHAALLLFGIPFGTVIGILSLIYLTRPEVRAYFESAQVK